MFVLRHILAMLFAIACLAVSSCVFLAVSIVLNLLGVMS